MPSNLENSAQRISSAIVSKDVSASCAMSDDWNNRDKLGDYEDEVTSIFFIYNICQKK